MSSALTQNTRRVHIPDPPRSISLPALLTWLTKRPPSSIGQGPLRTGNYPCSPFFLPRDRILVRIFATKEEKIQDGKSRPPHEDRPEEKQFSSFLTSGCWVFRRAEQSAKTERRKNVRNFIKDPWKKIERSTRKILSTFHPNNIPKHFSLFKKFIHTTSIKMKMKINTHRYTHERKIVAGRARGANDIRVWKCACIIQRGALSGLKKSCEERLIALLIIIQFTLCLIIKSRRNKKTTAVFRSKAQQKPILTPLDWLIDWL